MRYSTAKTAMWCFIGSEAVFFLLLIFAYVYFQSAVSAGPTASNSLDPPVTLIYTVCLLASSGALIMAERQLAASRTRAFQSWLGATILLGAVFLFGQSREYMKLIAARVVPARNVFAASFFTLTGFHGFHVLCGLIALAVMLGIALRSPMTSADHNGLAGIALYWHFVDVVWIVIFSIVYLSVWL